MRYFIFFYCLLLSWLALHAQTTSTGLFFASEQAMPGYVLFENNRGNFLIDECGRVVHSWDWFGRSRLHAKLLPNGNLIHISPDRSVDVYNWEGELLSRTYPTDPDIILDYEVIVLPNGNYLCVGRHSFSEEDFTAIGYDLAM
ncbi:MAG: hypothetical protein D6772_05050, partial [Bacteroidetes bacterium]